MNDAGMYDGIIPFRVVINEQYEAYIRFRGLTSAGKWRARKYDLRPYLEEVYNDWIQGADRVREILEKFLKRGLTRADTDCIMSM